MSRPDPAARAPLRSATLFRHALRGAILALIPVLAGAQAPAPRLDFAPAEMALARAVASDPGLAAWYGTNGLRAIFAAPEAAARRQAVIAAVAGAPGHGLSPARYGLDRLRALDAAGADGPDAEAAFARAFARWTRDLGGGVLDPRRIDPGIRREVIRVPTERLLARFVQSADPATALAMVEPQDPRYQALKRALAAEAALVAPAGVAPVPEGTLRPGMEGESVRLLRARLAAMGFDAAGADAALFDAPLTDAVMAFQTRAGLPADGIAGPKTIARLNQRRGPRSRALLIALERMRWLNGHDLSARHVWVNLPSYTAQVMDGGQVVLDTRVVIGKSGADYKTPEFSDEMEHLVVNPRWNVPRSITVREYLPRLKANRYAVSHLDIVDSRGRIVSRDRIDFGRYTAASFPYRMRQKPSDDNALGQVKFIFPNSMNIYLHDTPTKHLFGQQNRAYSHGCIRVAKPVELAEELLRGQVDDPAATYARALRSGKETWLKLDPQIPVHLVYFTTLADADGTLRHWPDIYGRDAGVWAALERAGVDAGLETAALVE